MRNTENVKTAENIKSAESVKDAEGAKNARGAENLRDAKSSGNVKNMGSARHAGSSGNVEHARDAKGSGNAGNARHAGNADVWRERLTGLVFPRRCPVCGDIVLPRGQLICPGCVEKLSPVRQPVCAVCGKEVGDSDTELCRDCLRHPKSFRHNFALLNYDDAARRSVTAIKYKNRREYLDFYGKAVCRRFGSRLRKLHPDALVPVPVHNSRLRSRGYNQAQLLAERVGRELGIAVYPKALRRVKKTLPQKELNPDERLKNLQEAFEAGQLPPDVKTAILVDDIYTTGSTMEACTRILLSMGVREVYGLTICIGHGM